MTEQPENQSSSTEIQFGESAKWHVEALIKDQITIEDAAEKLNFLYVHIKNPKAKNLYIRDLQAYLIDLVSKSSNENQNAVDIHTQELFELLIQKMMESEFEVDLTRQLGVQTRKRVQQVTH